MQFLTKKSSKKESKLNQNRKGGLPRGLASTLGVPIGTWQVPIGPNSWLSLGTF